MDDASRIPTEKILSYRARADRCRCDAENARSSIEEEAWLDLAEDWDKLADAFEREQGLEWIQ
jgi:hypothetical protein